MSEIKIPTVALSPDAVIPVRAYQNDAGCDLCSTQALTLKPFERCLIPTGLSIEIPQGYAGLILPRSGLAINKGLSLVNAPGLIDSNFRGELKVIAINLDPHNDIEINVGDRVAQFMLTEAKPISFTLVEALEDSERGVGGFGSSGV